MFVGGYCHMHVLAVPAMVGFALVLVGALALARFGAPEADADGHEEPATLPIG
jgi:hypothetical protein